MLVMFTRTFRESSFYIKKPIQICYALGVIKETKLNKQCGYVKQQEGNFKDQNLNFLK
jgi:hypothetical protein